MLTKEKRSKKEKVIITGITRRELFPIIITTFTPPSIQLRKGREWS